MSHQSPKLPLVIVKPTECQELLGDRIQARLLLHVAHMLEQWGMGISQIISKQTINEQNISR